MHPFLSLMQYLYLYLGKETIQNSCSSSNKNLEIPYFFSPNYLMPISHFRKVVGSKENKFMQKVSQTLPIFLVLLAFI